MTIQKGSVDMKLNRSAGYCYMMCSRMRYAGKYVRMQQTIFTLHL